MTQVPSLGIFACRQSIIGHEKQALKIQNKTILLQPNLTKPKPTVKKKFNLVSCAQTKQLKERDII